MSDGPSLDGYFRPLDEEHRRMLEDRLETYEQQLADQGYEATIAEGGGGLFAGVLVIDDERGRFGFLEADGSIAWLGDGTSGLGALGGAVAQNQGPKLEESLPDDDRVDTE